MMAATATVSGIPGLPTPQVSLLLFSTLLPFMRLLSTPLLGGLRRVTPRLAALAGEHLRSAAHRAAHRWATLARWGRRGVWRLGVGKRWLPAIGVACALYGVGASAEELRLDVNQADAAALCKLPGIGEKRARAIIARRERRPYTRLTQLLEVRGIGRKTLARLRPFLFVGEPGQIQLPADHPLKRRSSPSAVRAR